MGPSAAFNSTVIGSSENTLSPPYATEGGHVPIYSMAHGLIQKRLWTFRNREWCELCKEPVAVWVNHMGRKDHALLDMHYTAIGEYPRRWNPETVLSEFLDELGVGEMEPYHRVYGRHDQERRNDLYALMLHLEEEGMLFFGEPKNSYLARMQGGFRGTDLQGALVLHELILGPFLRLYPNAHIQDFSNLLDFVSCGYNLETVYDLCRFYQLDAVALSANYQATSPAAVGLGGIATSSSASHGFEQDTQTATPSSSAAQNAAIQRAQRQQEDLDSEAFSRKAVFVRQILGQLRWLMQPDQVHPAGFTFPEHVLTLGETCLKALVVEIVMARMCEYMVRVEPTWRQFGYERPRLDAKRVAEAANDVVPTLAKYPYRPMSPRLDDYYSARADGTLEMEMREKLALRRQHKPSTA